MADRRGIPWSPDMWDGVEGDISPELPSWSATIAMILDNFDVDFNTKPVAVTLVRRELTSRTNGRTVLTLSYCCARGLTVKETLGYFGEAAVAYHVCGTGHPTADLYDLLSAGKGDDMMSHYVQFQDNVNPLSEIAA